MPGDAFGNQRVPYGVQHAGVIGLLLLTALLTGCGSTGSSKSSFIKHTVHAASGQLPPEATATLTLLDPAVLNTLPRLNPFASLIALKKIDSNPRSLLPEINPSSPIDLKPPPPPADPFSGLSLDGILYRPRNATAILAFQDGKTQIVHTGDTLVVQGQPDYQIRVANILKNTVTLQVLNPPPDLPPGQRIKALQIASLIGYNARKASPKKAAPSGMAVPPSPGEQALLTQGNDVPTEIQDLINEVNGSSTLNGTNETTETTNAN